MERRHRDIIDRNCVKFERDLIVTREFLNLFIQADIFNDQWIEEILIKKLSRERSSEFVSRIKRRGPQAFQVLIDALCQTGQSHLAKIIDPNGEYHCLDARPATSTQETREPAPSAVFYYNSAPGLIGGQQKQPGHSSRDGDGPPPKPAPPTGGRKKPSEMKRGKLKQLKMDERVYSINDHGQRGRAIILANDIYTCEEEGPVKLKDRDGSSRDLFKLHRLFTQLGYDVIPWANLTAEDVKRKIGEEKQCPAHKTADSFIFVCMSHGSRDRIFDKNCKHMEIEKDIIQPFDGENWEIFCSKPKLFFIQACQSDGAGGDTCGVVVPESPDSDVKPLPTQPSIIHQKAHIFIFKATVSGYKSYRDVTKGSWFVQDLVESFYESCHEDDLATIALQVKEKVHARATKTCEFKQVPEDSSTLLKKVYFPYLGDQWS